MNVKSHLQTAAAGEYYVAAELSRRDWQVLMSPHQPTFDIAAVRGQLVHRIQVKTVAKPAAESDTRTPRYNFRAQHRIRRQPYTIDDCDFVVFVGLEHQAFFILPIADLTVTAYSWTPGVPTTILQPYFNAWQLLEK